MTNKSVLVLAGHGTRVRRGGEEYRAFVEALRARAPEQPIVAAALEYDDPPIINALRASAADGYRHAIVQPLLLFGATHQKNDIPAALTWAREHLPKLQISYGRPFGPHPALLEALDGRISAADDGAVPPEETAILVVGRGTSDPDANSEVAQLTRLLWEGRDWAFVEVAYSGETRPTVEEGVRRCVRLGARRVIVAPLLLFQGILTQRIDEQARTTARELGVPVAVAGSLGAHPALLSLTLERAAEAAAGPVAMNCDRCKYRVALRGFEAELGRAQHSDHHHGLRGLDRPLLGAVPRAIDDTQPGMGAAELRFLPDGTVEWGAMWQDFCELALTGGPSVRDNVLRSPVDAALATTTTDAVAQEIARGIKETTGLSVTDLSQPGWVGFACEDERMAVWVAAAIIVENITARFDGTMVYVPAAPSWRLKAEIKNVITAVAKTCHYWQEHRPQPARVPETAL